MRHQRHHKGTLATLYFIFELNLLHFICVFNNKGRRSGETQQDQAGRQEIASNSQVPEQQQQRTFDEDLLPERTSRDLEP